MIDFIDYEESREYKYKVLMWLNITQDKAEEDSGVFVAKKILSVMTKARPDVYWVIVTRESTGLLSFPHSTIIPYPFPKNPNSMRCHFLPFEVENILKEHDIDVIYSHVPEHTARLVNIVENRTGLRPKVVGYEHWIELDENDTRKQSTVMSNLSGVLAMEECGFNSQWQIDIFLREAEKNLSKQNVDKLRRIVKIHRLGTMFDNTPPESIITKTLVFNHRADGYTGWADLLKVLDELWKKRQDWRLRKTLDCEEERPYLTSLGKLDTTAYKQVLKQGVIGIGFFQKYSAWSLSVTDGFACGLPYLLPNRYCYPEMVGAEYPLLYSTNEEFLVKLESALDIPTFRQDHEESIRSIIKRLPTWEQSILTWFDNWSFLEKDWIKFQKSETYPKIIAFIKHRGAGVTRKDLYRKFGWGSASVDYAYYRNMLRDDSRIKLAKNGYEFRG